MKQDKHHDANPLAMRQDKRHEARLLDMKQAFAMKHCQLPV